MKKQKVSVIITSYNNGHNIKECLKSLTAQDYSKNLINLEIIIVDSGSTDNSLDVLNEYKDKIRPILNPLGSPRLSPAVARNIGVRSSQGEMLIFSDSDCSFSPNWINDMVLSLKDPVVSCVIGNREPDIGKGLGFFYRKYNFLLRSRKAAISETLFINKKTVHKETPLILIAANNFAIKRKYWEKIGGMKTYFAKPAGEDIMIELELIERGYNVLFNPLTKVIHNHPLSLKNLLRRAFFQGESIYLINKHFEGYISWKHFLQLKDFFRGVIFCVLLFLIMGLVGFPFLYEIIFLVGVVLIFFTEEIIRIRKRLNIILDSKNKPYKKKYQFPFFGLFLFVIIDFVVKTIRLSGFICSNVKAKFKLLGE